MALADARIISQLPIAVAKGRPVQIEDARPLAALKTDCLGT